MTACSLCGHEVVLEHGTAMVHLIDGGYAYLGHAPAPRPDDADAPGYVRPYHRHADGTEHAHPGGAEPHYHLRTWHPHGDRWTPRRAAALLRRLADEGVVRVRRWPCGHAHRYADRAVTCTTEPELPLALVDLTPGRPPEVRPADYARSIELARLAFATFPDTGPIAFTDGEHDWTVTAAEAAP